MVIANESRVAKSRVVTTFNKARQVLVNLAIRYIPSSMYMAPPASSMSITHLLGDCEQGRARGDSPGLCCRYQDVEKVTAITKNIRLHLETNLGVDQRLPLGTCLTVRPFRPASSSQI